MNPQNPKHATSPKWLTSSSINPRTKSHRSRSLTKSSSRGSLSPQTSKSDRSHLTFTSSVKKSKEVTSTCSSRVLARCRTCNKSGGSLLTILMGGNGTLSQQCGSNSGSNRTLTKKLSTMSTNTSATSNKISNSRSHKRKC
jgi:hypothetical protein